MENFENLKAKVVDVKRSIKFADTDRVLSYYFHLIKTKPVFDSTDVTEDSNITNHRSAACFVMLLTVFLPSNCCKNLHHSYKCKLFSQTNISKISFSFVSITPAGIAILQQSDWYRYVDMAGVGLPT